MIALCSRLSLNLICGEFEYVFTKTNFFRQMEFDLSLGYEENYTFCEGEETGTLAYSPADSPVAMFGGTPNLAPADAIQLSPIELQNLSLWRHIQIEFPTRSGN